MNATQKRNQNPPPQRCKKPLRIFQANVDKGREKHLTALQLANAHEYDIILIQEPWTYITPRGDCITAIHATYNTFLPVRQWSDTSTRPRVSTYIRKTDGLIGNQLSITRTRDILWTVVGNTTIVNIYRDPQVQETLDILLNWTIPPYCIIAGDFNARYHTWDNTGYNYNKGHIIATWAEEQGLAITNPPNAPTHIDNGTIDLVLTNIPLAETTVEDHLHTLSTHFTLSTTLPTYQFTAPANTKIIIKDDEEIQKFANCVAEAAHLLPPVGRTAESAESAAIALSDLLQTATRMAGRPPRQAAKRFRWWNEECTKAHQEALAVKRRVGPRAELYRETVKSFRKIVSKAKKTHTREFISDLPKTDDIFKITRWIRAPSQIQPPPLQVGEQLFTSQLDRANALRKATLERREAGDDIEDPWFPLEQDPIVINIPLTVSLEEASQAVTCTGNTSPGSDNITTALLKAAWPHVGEYIRELYERCIASGIHPSPFKEAEVVMIPKPGKRDLSTPRSWRPISLLSCLGKGLERLIAKRIAYTAVRDQILHPTQAGALPKRSAVDLVAALVHDIEQALNRGKVATVTTMDILGAFDAILRNRLILRLRQQGWPYSLVRWVASFMSNRKARVRLQETTTELAPLSCGLPQGSPISPILFLLYTEPIYKITSTCLPAHQLHGIKAKVQGPQAIRFGYADDVANLRIGNTLEETAQLSTNDIQQIEDWGKKNAITFDAAKSDVMHFSRKMNKEAPPVYHAGQPLVPGTSMRWLGVWLDRKLSFKDHVTRMANKARIVSNLLRGISGIKYGPPPEKARKAAKACIEPILLYGTEAWYPGATKQTTQGTKTNRITDTVNRIQTAQQAAIRAILPTWRTTPIPVLHREAGLPNAEGLLNQARLRFAARLQSLDANHPLTTRVNSRHTASKTLTRLQRTAGLLPRAPRPILRLDPPLDPSLSPTEGKTKEEAAKDFLDWLEWLPQETVVIYTDGSKNGNKVGFGYTVTKTNQTIIEGSGRLGPAEVYDGEVCGALAGLRAALQAAPNAQQYVVCLDNTSVITGLEGGTVNSSQAEFITFSTLRKSHPIEIKWCPGHKNIPGNERADQLAKEGTEQPPPPGAHPTLAAVRAMAKARPRKDFSIWWEQNQPESYSRWELKASLQCPKELKLDRPLLHRLLAARSGHGDFATYHERFAHADVLLTCSCGKRKDPAHPFYCRKVDKKYRTKLTPWPADLISQAIGSRFKRYILLIEKANFFNNICPNH